ncbi:MAG: glycosyltransferase N-terminal domain-containing protein [Bacteroidota bacterium]|nr:glycosyltransferase N-terminal domain-containing protein [Bacteroidota bacterium]
MLYNIALNLYQLAIKIAALGKTLRAVQRQYGESTEHWDKLKGALAERKSEHKTLWIHAASLGEFEQGRVLLDFIFDHYKEYFVLLSFSSPSGYEIRKTYPKAHYVCYLPIDSAKRARNWVELVKPNLFIGIKYEFWYHYFKQLYLTKVPIVMISVVMRQNQIYFKWYGSLHRKILSFVNVFFMQDQQSLESLKSICHNKQIVLNGDTRVDQVLRIAENVKPIPLIENWLNGNKAVIAGSIYEQENLFISKLYKQGIITDKIILVPHQVNDRNIALIASQWGENVLLFSELSIDKIQTCDVLIIDIIGILSNSYQYSSYCFIGGGFGKGIHNTLEPAAFGKALIYGPNYHKFPEAEHFVEHRGGFAFENYTQLVEIIKHLELKENMEVAKNVTGEYIVNNAHSTEKIMNWLTDNKLL